METDFREQHALEWKQVYKKLKEHKKSHLIKGKAQKKQFVADLSVKGEGAWGQTPVNNQNRFFYKEKKTLLNLLIHISKNNFKKKSRKSAKKRVLPYWGGGRLRTLRMYMIFLRLPLALSDTSFLFSECSVFLNFCDYRT